MFERSLRELHEEVARRAYEICQMRGFTHGYDLDDWLQAEAEKLRFVPVDVTEDENEVRVYAEVPGFSGKDLDILLEPERLVIRGKAEYSKERYKGGISYSERETNQIFRAVNLPTEVAVDKANAVLHDGVLELTLPKAEAAKATRVQVRAA